jgi:large subunit ribosomal protein L15
MINLSSLKATPGSRPQSVRIGLGEGSGHGQTATRGQKGQRSRSGDGKLVGFEGGQTPLLRRVPKRGFSNRAFRVRYQVVSLTDIERVFKNQKEVNLEAFRIHGLVNGKRPVKVLGGDLKRAYTITANAFSAGAKATIEKAGGSAVVLPSPTE